MIVFSSFRNVVLSHSMFADCCMLKSWEWGPMVAVGQQQPPWSINVQAHLLLESSLPALLPPILPLLPPCIIPQWCCCPDNTTQWPIWCGGCCADSSNANEDAHCHLVGRVSLIAWYESLCIPTYDTTHNQPTMSVNVLWPKWLIAAAMVPHSQRWRIQQLPRMLANCRMRWRGEWGTLAAVGRRQPPRLAGHGLASFS